MADRTLAVMIANVQRKVGSGPAIPRLEIMQALNTAHLEIHGAYDWPWAYKETNINVNPSYSTGTISATVGSATVTGAGTTWSTGWTNRRLKLGASDWPVLSFGGVGTLLLVQPFHGEANLSGEAYTIYQDVFQMPADFEPGKDLTLVGTSGRDRIRHIPRMSLETEGTYGYADYGRDSTGRHLIRISPSPTDTSVMRLVYKARPTDFTSLLQIPWLPQTYQDILELMAEAEVKRTNGVPGWEVPAAIAARKKLEMKRQVISGPVDNRSDEFTNDSGGYGGRWWRHVGGY
jgi:hypothetical protein